MAWTVEENTNERKRERELNGGVREGAWLNGFKYGCVWMIFDHFATQPKNREDIGPRTKVENSLKTKYSYILHTPH